ncbi:hypothetical protein B0H13DRAFT_2394081 [Mycena leptocephala]|nr:hypothetical protein B0H13DRAFT_2394081 [Mycena leptocephala]
MYIAIILSSLLIGALILWVPNGKVRHGTPLSFSVAFGEEVALRIALTPEHYGVDESADEEWDKLLPSGGHLVYVAEDMAVSPTPYTVTLFHQFKCLSIIRAQYKLPPRTPITPQTRHCMNYLRQTILCGLNLRIESVEEVSGLTDRYLYDTVCRDWRNLYEEAERNQLAYMEWKKDTVQDG